MCPAVLLSSLSTDAVCEHLRQMDGVDPNMLPQYAAKIKKVQISSFICVFLNYYLIYIVFVSYIDDTFLQILLLYLVLVFHIKVLICVLQANVNGRVLTHCNLDELKREMEMNFGDWQLFRGMVRQSSFT